MTERVPCKVCQRLFSAAYLPVHKRVHTGEKPYKCTLCDKQFMFHSGIHYHKKTAHPVLESPVRESLEYEYVMSGNTSGVTGARCTICHKLFPNKAGLRTHGRVHNRTEDTSCECEKCHRRFSNSELHDNHECKEPSPVNTELTQREPNQTDMVVKCLHCSKSFSSDNKLAIHMKVHSADKLLLRCKTCYKFFRNSDNLKFHMESEHENSNFPCTKCEKTFSKKFRLNLHMRSHSSGLTLKQTSSDNTTIAGDVSMIPGKREQCSLCRKMFGDRRSLILHSKVHIRPKKTYKCSICSAGFARQYHLALHSRIHELADSRPYKCTFCHAGFIKDFTCRLHMSKIHNLGFDEEDLIGTRAGGEVHECVICWKILDSPTDLIKHMKSHKSNLSSETSVVDDKSADVYKGRNVFDFDNEESEINSGIKQEITYDNNEFNSKDGNKIPYSKTLANLKILNKDILQSYIVDNSKMSTTSTCTVTGRLIFNCDVCDTTFTKKENLRRHVKNRAYDHGMYLKKKTGEDQNIFITGTKKTAPESEIYNRRLLSDQVIDTTNKSVDYPNIIRDRSIGPDINSDKSVDTPDINTDKSVDTSNMQRDMPAKTPDINTGKSVDTPDMQRHMPVKTPDIITGKSVDTPIMQRVMPVKTPDINTGKSVDTPDRHTDISVDTPDINKDIHKNKITEIKKMRRYKYVCDVCGLSYTRKLNMRQHRNKHTDAAFMRAGVRREELENTRADKVVSKTPSSSGKNDSRTGTFLGFDIYMDTDEVPDYDDLVNMSSDKTTKHSDSSTEIINTKGETKISMDINTFSSSATRENIKVSSFDAHSGRNNDSESKPNNGNISNIKCEHDSVMKSSITSECSPNEKPDNCLASDIKTEIQENAEVSFTPDQIIHSDSKCGNNKTSDVKPEHDDGTVRTPSSQTDSTANHNTSDNEHTNKGIASGENPRTIQDPETQKPEDEKMCPDCALPILNGQSTIGCQLCHTRFCITCSGVPREVYQLAFMDESNSPVVWLCKVCKPLFPKFTLLLHQLGEFEESIDDRVADLEKKLKMMKNNQRLLLQSVTKKSK